MQASRTLHLLRRQNPASFSVLLSLLLAGLLARLHALTLSEPAPCSVHARARTKVCMQSCEKGSLALVPCSALSSSPKHAGSSARIPQHTSKFQPSSRPAAEDGRADTPTLPSLSLPTPEIKDTFLPADASAASMLRSARRASPL